MSVLSALLARDRVVSPQKIDEAIQRQVINGGDFETNLLEIGALSEDTLAAYCAAVCEGMPIGRDEITQASLAALARLSKESAEALRVVPVSITEGRMLLAGVVPLADTDRDRVEREVGMPVEIRIATPFRIAWALAKFFGAELSPRLQRLAARLSRSASGEMTAVSRAPSIPPPANPSRPPPAAKNALRPSVLAALSAALADDRESTVPPEPAQAHAPTHLSEGPQLRPSLTNTLVAALTAKSTPEDEASGRFSVPPPSTPSPRMPSSPPPAPAPSAADVVERPAPAKPPAAPAVAPASIAQAVESNVAEETRDTVPHAESFATSAKRASISFADAQSRIQSADDRDAILDALLDFASGEVMYAATFVIHGDVAEGLDARGDGLDGAAARGIAVPLDAPGSFRAVRARGEPVIGALNPSGTDALIKHDLGRDSVNYVALLPILIGGRVALIVWADQGSSALNLAGVDRLSTLCLDAAVAFEKIIRERKKRRVASETAAAAAAAIATGSQPTITAGDIQRRFAEQRGAKALQRLATQSTPPGPANPSDESPTPAMPSNPPQARSKPPAAPGTGDELRDGTRFARGGRVPIAVDVVGPLPPATVPADLHRTLRTTDPRREPEEVAQPSPGFDDTARLLSEVVRTGHLSDAAANEILGAGERALATVFKYFPGPTHIDRTNTHARLPSVSEIGPLLRLVVMFRQASGPYLLEQLESYDPERRYYATLCLGEVVFAPALQPLVARLYDTDYPTAAAAVEALRAYRRTPAYEEALSALREIVAQPNAPTDRRRTAANVLGELRDTEAVRALIQTLQDRDGALAGIARRSLVTLSRQDFGQDAAAWERWWSDARSKHRVEWLIDSLLNADPTLRHDASEELKKLTGQFFGYYYNLPRRERERAHGRYLEWWEREGRVRFR